MEWKEYSILQQEPTPEDEEDASPIRPHSKTWSHSRSFGILLLAFTLSLTLNALFAFKLLQTISHCETPGTPYGEQRAYVYPRHPLTPHRSQPPPKRRHPLGPPHPLRQRRRSRKQALGRHQHRRWYRSAFRRLRQIQGSPSRAPLPVG